MGFLASVMQRPLQLHCTWGGERCQNPSNCPSVKPAETQGSSERVGRDHVGAESKATLGAPSAEDWDTTPFSQIRYEPLKRMPDNWICVYLSVFLTPNAEES